MGLKLGLGAAALAVGMSIAGQPVLADDTGFATMHDLRRERGRLCMSDHFHYGNSSGLRSRKAAQAAAIRSWAEFTDFEYGSDWARFGRAASKGMKCSQSGGSWGCEVEARPCK